ncbi:hypothetical protein [Flexibacterium corallicola]|uniref:hypothetical protein n=1 Tax=Flexibacterium corallicola TaxID=3037259 RepID=UPI00286EE9DF|nr:hypothetical protein [Pseudovibrio sp. M1P-2-3]
MKRVKRLSDYDDEKKKEFISKLLIHDVAQEMSDNQTVIETMSSVISQVPFAQKGLIYFFQNRDHFGLTPAGAANLTHTLVTGMVTEYARCFTGGVKKIDPAKVFNEEELNLHEALITDRSKYFAHDVNDSRETYINLKVSTKEEEYYFEPTYRRTEFQSQYIETLNKLAKKTLNHLEHENKKNDHILQEYLSSQTIDDLRSLKDFDFSENKRKNKSKRQPRHRQL